MTVGPYNVSLIEAGDFRLDGGAMFGVVPKILWNRQCPADDLNRISMTMRALLIEGHGRRILVDTGAGDKDGQKFRDLYALDDSQKSMVRSLAARGLKTDEITDVILTHLHFDHAGGATRLEDGHAIPTFPKAKYYVQRRHWQHAMQPTERDKASFFPANYQPLEEAGQLELVDGDGELFPGIELLVMNGHTPGMQTVKVSDGSSQALWYPADLLPMSPHVPLPYIMGYDLFPMTTLAEKKQYLPRAVDENWTVVFEHDPGNPATTVVRDERGQFVRGPAVEVAE